MAMTEYINDLLNQLRKQITKRPAKQSPPCVKRYKNKNKKTGKPTISVTSNFNSGEIKKVKLIATYEQWLGLYNFDPEQNIYEAIEPYLSRPTKRVRNNLKQYAKTDPIGFANDVSVCVECANYENPEYRPAKKPRRLEHEKIDRHKMNEIRDTARHLYIYLKYWLNQPANKRPEKLKKLVNRYGIVDFWFTNPKMATMYVITSRFDEIDINKIDDTETFYKEYIACQPLSNLNRSKRIKDGDSPCLNKILT
jgi:hypothetical protein